MNKWIVMGALAFMLAAPAVAFAQPHEPALNVGRRHPNLEAAQRLCVQAYNRLVDSQRANEWDEGGHAQKAKELLDEVNRQIKEAAIFDNHKPK